MQLKLGAILTFAISFSSVVALGDLLSPAVQTAGKVTVEMSQRIAAGTITQTELATALGSAQQASSLWAAISTLRTQGGLPQSQSDWAALRNIVENQSLSSNDVIGKFKLAAQNRTALNRTTMARFFGNESPASTTDVAITETPQETFRRYQPQSPRTQQLKQSLISSGSRIAELRIETLGRLLQAAQKTPQVCSAAAKKYCADAAGEAVMLMGVENLDQAGPLAVQFADDVLSGFKNENPSYVGRAEVTLQGYIGALKLGNNRPEQLQNCLWKGSPSVN